jgi:riboflavin synthase
MFTGIIEEIGTVKSATSASDGKRLRVAAPRSVKGLRVNDSVAVNGVCLTVIRKAGSVFEAEAVEETLKKSTLGLLKAGNKVNLELPMKLNERLGGHLVLGHVDTVGNVSKLERLKGSTLVTIAAGKEFSKYIIPVGSVAVDGISLTVARVTEEGFVVAIIPHTLKHTVVQGYRVGTNVNLEFDLVGKYIERMAFSRTFPAEEELRANGY